MRVVFHGEIAVALGETFRDFLPEITEISLLPEEFTNEADRRAYASADVIVSFKFHKGLPHPERLKLFHVPGAGYDAIDFDALPSHVVVCNCFGHEQAIAEYAFAAMMRHLVPLNEADKHLRQGDWSHRVGPAHTVHEELAEKTVGLLGFGHIGKAVAARAKAFEMKVHVANRSVVPVSPLVDRSFLLDDLADFWASADFFVISIPLAKETTGIVGVEAFAAMRSSAVIINVGRGPTINEHALFDALKSRRIAGAAIDTWYIYPSKERPQVFPAELPFHELSNVVMTPHMSGWTRGTIRRRQKTIADNIARYMRGETCINVVRAPQT